MNLLGTLSFIFLTAISGPAAAEERDPVSAARAAVAKGDDIYREGRILAACRQYEIAVNVAPEWWYPAYKKALCDMGKGRYRDAFYLLSRARASDIEMYVLHLTLARWYRINGPPDEAQAWYRKTIALTRGAIEPMLELADVLIREKELGEARLVLKRAEYFSSTNLAVRSRLALVSEPLGHLADTERHLHYLSTRGVNIRRNLVLLARFYNRRGASSQAKETLRNLTNPQRNGIVLLPELMGEFTGEAGTK